MSDVCVLCNKSLDVGVHVGTVAGLSCCRFKTPGHWLAILRGRVGKNSSLYKDALKRLERFKPRISPNQSDNDYARYMWNDPQLNDPGGFFAKNLVNIIVNFEKARETLCPKCGRPLMKNGPYESCVCPVPDGGLPEREY